MKIFGYEIQKLPTPDTRSNNEKLEDAIDNVNIAWKAVLRDGPRVSLWVDHAEKELTLVSWGNKITKLYP